MTKEELKKIIAKKETGGFAYLFFRVTFNWCIGWQKQNRD